MSDEHTTRCLTLPDGSVIRTAIPSSDVDLPDEQFFGRYPAVRDLAERWAAEAWDPGS
ncbi:hypothetical protein ACIRD2_32025 [Streptomyces sp. NPDC093595]|jgi:hypothetical protein|uniref:hypothetical protein n=1 Tax=unclassified Streptomyces TaxID=2593676 RepID=UPI0037A7B0D8